MDYLRSCYSTKAVLTPGGPQVTIDWYRPGAFTPPYPGRHVFGSLNWSRPNYGAGEVGEVVGAPRPWRDGSVPSYEADAWFALGEPADYLGLGHSRSAPWPITWRGGRVDQDIFGVGPGLFPPYAFPGGPGILTSNIFGVANPLPPFPGRNTWSWPGRLPVISVSWSTELLPEWFSCFPGMAVLFVEPQWPAIFWCRCASYDPAAGVSTWTDGGSGVLAPGEVLTLVGNAGPAYP